MTTVGAGAPADGAFDTAFAEDPGAEDRRRRRRVLLALFLGVTAVAGLVAGGHSYGIDNEVQFQTTRSLVQLEPYLLSVDSGWADSDIGPYRERPDGKPVAIVAIGQSLVAAPFYATSRAFAQFLPAEDRDAFVRFGTFLTNAVVMGLLAVTVALVALELIDDRRAAIGIALAYALCTYALPHVKTFFTELTSALAVTAGVLMALRYRRTGAQRYAVLCGLLAGFGVMVRPSAALFVPIFAAWLLVVAARQRGWPDGLRAVGAFAAGGIPMVIAFAGFNWWRFGDPFDIGYQQVPQSYPLLKGLTNQFFRPGKSLFLFAPVILLGFAGLVVGLRRRTTAAMVLIGGLVAMNVLFFSRVPFWAGDTAWGPRYQQIVLPLMCVPAVALAARWWWRAALVVLAGVGALLPALLGVAINFNVLFIEVAETGADGIAIVDTLEWHPFLGHLELIPAGIRDVFDENRPLERDRGPYSGDPFTHYGYFGWEPRIDVWWLWVAPMNANPAAYVFLVPLLAALAHSLSLVWGLTASRRRPGDDEAEDHRRYPLSPC